MQYLEAWQQKRIAQLKPSAASDRRKANDTPHAHQSSKRFRIALSFPGERRDFVGQVAQRLAVELGTHRVLYDGYYEAEFARPDLDTYLQRLYRDESELVAVFLCADYEHKEWCGLEWRAIRELIKQRKAESVMPLRFDDTKIPGLFSIDGYVRIDDRAPEQIAQLILQRLGNESGAPANTVQNLAQSIPQAESPKPRALTKSDRPQLQIELPTLEPSSAKCQFVIKNIGPSEGTIFQSRVIFLYNAPGATIYTQIDAGDFHRVGRTTLAALIPPGQTLTFPVLDKERIQECLDANKSFLLRIALDYSDSNDDKYRVRALFLYDAVLRIFYATELPDSPPPDRHFNFSE